jgi:hypothetical protein
MYRLTVIALGVTVLVVFSSGCGSSGSGADASAASSSNGGDITKAQFIKQAEAICAKNAKERKAAIAAWERESSGSASMEEGLIEIVAPALTEEAAALRALDPPAGDQATVTKMIENLAVSSKKVEEGSPGPAIAKFLREADAYGLKTCARL